jgi:hypothetical protein
VETAGPAPARLERDLPVPNYLGGVFVESCGEVVPLVDVSGGVVVDGLL